MIHVTDEQWDRIREHFPEESIPEDRPGRKPVPARKVLDAVLWILNTGLAFRRCRDAFPGNFRRGQRGGLGVTSAL